MMVSQKLVALRVLSIIYLVRYMDSKSAKLARQNKGGTFQIAATGHELVGALVALRLVPGKDWAFPYYRDRAVVIGLGSSLTDLFGAFLARDVSHHSGGRMMPDHFVHRELHIPCQSSVVGTQFLQAVGVAKAIQYYQLDEVVYVSAGEGATSQGDFHEALNFAALHRLPILFVIQDNGWAISVPRSEQTAGGSVARIAKGYEGVWVEEVDGCDFEALSATLDRAFSRIRSKEGPALLVAQVVRMAPHSNSDDPLKYLDQESLDQFSKKDPLSRLERWLIEEGKASVEEIEQLKASAIEQVEQAALEAEKIPFPKAESAADKVFIPFSEKSTVPLDGKGEPIVMVDALNHALDEAMEEDPDVILFGEDVAAGKGGVFSVTRGLTAKYGNRRCFNTPLAESTIIGVGLGISLVGNMKPVVEIQFADYIWPGINQLVSEVASIYYRSNGEFHAPLVVRLPYGGYIQGGPYHSQSIEGFLAHVPGLKIVIPSNAADAKCLLKAAIRDPNPILFLEHKALYRQRIFCARPEPSREAIVAIGKAEIVRSGSHVTFVGWGMMVVIVFEVAARLAKEGIEVEIIDLRTIIPWDREAVIDSVKKSGKLLIAHEAPRTAGFAAEIAATIGEVAFPFLDAPILRVAAKDSPIPYCKELETAILPQAADIEKALRTLALY